MRAFTKILAGGVAIAALASAAPAAAQYYPGYGYPAPGYGYGNGNVIGQIINGITGGYGQPYAVNSQAVVNQCANAVQARLSGGYGGAYGAPGYGGYGGYGAPAYGGYNQYGQMGGRVLGISRVETRSSGGLTVRGVANSGRLAAYGYGHNQGRVDLVWKCRTDARGIIIDVDIDPAQANYGANYTPWTNSYSNDYSQYGYRRY